MRLFFISFLTAFLFFPANTTHLVVEEEIKEEVIELKTKIGSIYIWLYQDIPLHRSNFIKLTEEGHYDGTLFHRVITNFMIQGGDPYSKRKDKQDSLGEGDVGYSLKAEITRKYFHQRGVVAAARNPDDINPNRESSGCQFYIVQGRKMTDEDLLKYEKRVRDGIKDSTFTFTEKERKVYQEIGGTPWLDQQYTIFGEVISGMGIVDQIANAKRDKKDRPLKDYKMDMNVIRLTSTELKQRFSFTVPK